MINNIFKMAIICLILVGAAGCESKSKSSSQPPTQEQQAPIDGNDQQQVQPLSQKAITAFSAFNEFQDSITYEARNCGDSCTDSVQHINFQPIQIKGITPSEYQAYYHFTDDTSHEYKFMNPDNVNQDTFSEDGNEEAVLTLFNSNTIRYWDTDEATFLDNPLSTLADKIRNVYYAFIPEEFSINPNTGLPTTPIEMMHGAMVVYKPLYITQTKEDAERLDQDPSHISIEFHVKNNDGTTSIYSSANITNPEYANYNTHHNLTDETGTVVGSFLMTKVHPIDGKQNIYHDTIKFYDTNKTPF